MTVGGYHTWYVEGISPIHKLGFWTKFLCLLLLIPLSAFLATPPVLIFVMVVSGIMIVLSNIGLRLFWSKTKVYNIALPIMVVFLALAFSPGTLVERLLDGFVLSLRFLILTHLGVLFATVTNPLEIPLGLLRIGIPHRLGVTMMVAFRMFPLIAERFEMIILAQKARGAVFRPSRHTLRPFVLSLFSVLIPVFYATLQVSTELSDTLLTRGYDPNRPITVPPSQINLRDVGVFILSISTLIISVVPWTELSALPRVFGF
jgi:energy-coupling factor transporter transmembrane protein EcfT